ncbi:MAG: hypothetical protein N2Z67_06690 [Acetobacteraceae bacterium]|nr:hypothetical protein [Acetobacteraceae bacterium]
MSLNMHAATPPERVRRFSAEGESILRVPELRGLRTAEGAIIRRGTPEECLAFAREEAEKRGRLVRETGASAE